MSGRRFCSQLRIGSDWLPVLRRLDDLLGDDLLLRRLHDRDRNRALRVGSAARVVIDLHRHVVCNGDAFAWEADYELLCGQ